MTLVGREHRDTSGPRIPTRERNVEGLYSRSFYLCGRERGRKKRRSDQGLVANTASILDRSQSGRGARSFGARPWFLGMREAIGPCGNDPPLFDWISRTRQKQPVEEFGTNLGRRYWPTGLLVLHGQIDSSISSGGCTWGRNKKSRGSPRPHCHKYIMT